MFKFDIDKLVLLHWSHKWNKLIGYASDSMIKYAHHDMNIQKQS